MPSFQRIAVPAALAALLIAAPARANLISDGDFQGLPNGLAPGNATIVVNDWTFFDGAGVESIGANKVVRLESNGLATRDSTASQTVAGLTVGADYTLSWDLAMRIPFSGAANGPSFGVFLDSQTLANALLLDTYLSAAFAARSVTFTASATSHTFIFAGELDGRTNGAGLTGTTDVSYRIDNVSLVAASVSEPAGLGALALGLGALAWRRRAVQSVA